MDSPSSSDAPTDPPHRFERCLTAIESRRSLRVTVLLMGVVASQLILYGPSLLGHTLLLPMDCLGHGDTYLPPEWDGPDTSGHRWMFSDAILQVELDRIYAVREVRQGRLPFWNPYNYCGVPFLANNNSAVFSPFMIPSYLWPGPEVLAWTQLLRALVAAIGTYLFFRSTMAYGFVPALLGAWAFPLCGFLVMWNWIHFSSVVSLLPWILMATDIAVRGPRWRGVPLLAVMTSLVLFSGKLDTSAHVLLASGLFAIYGLLDQLRQGALSERPLRAVSAPVCGWLLGFGLAAPIVLPTQDYLQTSSRISFRAQGFVDFPPHGPAALAPLVLPYVYGNDVSEYVGYGNIMESTAIGYAGFLTALLLVPVGFSSGRRTQNVFWSVAGLFALATHVTIPLLSDVYALPVLNLLKNNRFVFWTSWCLIAMAVAGVEALQQRQRVWRWWLWITGIGVLALGVWCAHSAWSPAAAVTQWGEAVTAQFRWRYLEGVLLSCLTLSLLIGLCWFNHLPRIRSMALVVLVTAELIYQAYGFMPQTSPQLYYPEHALMAKAADSEPGRFCGVYIVAPSLNRSHWLPSVRGYDGADPNSFIRLLEIANPTLASEDAYARTNNFLPAFTPLLAMLNLRYRMGAGEPPRELANAERWKGHWLHVDPDALPRPYVPREVLPVEDQDAAFHYIANPEFDPRQAAFVEAPHQAYRTDVQGTVTILDEVPGRLRIRCRMESSGLVVLSDCWYPGWTARYAGQPNSVLRVNGALIGALVPEGEGILELTYRPRRFRLACWIMGLSLILTGACFGIGRFCKRRGRASSESVVD